VRERPVALGGTKLPVGGGVSTLVLGAIHLILAVITLIAGIASEETAPLVVGAIYAAITATVCILAGLTLRGSRGSAIAAGVILAIAAGFFALGTLGVALDDDRHDTDTLAFAIVATLTFLVPSILLFLDARKIRLARSATIANLQEAFQ
jgi:hypothetical protein